MATVIACDLDGLPELLRPKPHWVTWRNEPDPERPKPRKMPYGKDGKPAKADDPRTWLSYADAVAQLQRGRYDGLGWYAWRPAGVTIIDLDDCVDESGALTEEAQAIVDRFPGAYAELSQSGKGVHLVVKASPGFGHGRDGGRKGKVEVYASRHYLALTGSTLAGDREVVLARDFTAEVEQLCRDVGIALEGDLPVGPSAAAPGSIDPAPAPQPAGAQAPAAVTLSDEAVVAAVMRSKDAKRWFALYAGGEVPPGKASEADFELAAMLCRQTPDDEQVGRIMRTSPLKRAKWDAKRGAETFLQYTVRSARVRLSGGASGKGGSDQAISLAELAKNPELLRPPPVVVPHLAWAGRITLVAAREGLGKSTLFAAVAAAVTKGGSFAGLPCAAGPVLWCLVEEHLSDLAIRAQRFGTDGERFYVLDRPGDGVAALRTETIRLAPKLIIVDTLHAFAAGVVTDASAADQWQPLMTTLDELARTTNAAVLIAAQASKATGDYRDSTAIGHGVDVILTLARQKDAGPDDEDPVRDLLVKKARWKQPVVRVRFVEQGTTWAFEALDRPHPDVEAAALEDAVLRCVQAAWDETKKPVSGNYVHGVVGGKRARVFDLLRGLVADGQLEAPGDKGPWRPSAGPAL